MLKEIHEQPRAIAQTLEERIANGRLLEAAFGPAGGRCSSAVEAVHIVACGTSYHAGLVACYLIEQICRIPARVEIASEYRYRNPVVHAGHAVRDDLAVRRDRRYAGGAAHAGRPAYLSTLTICNVAESSLVRESELVLLTRAGRKSASPRPRRSRRS
jgi:glutamine---fructose-6-phosphate transaminase (isomerizing)